LDNRSEWQKEAYQAALEALEERIEQHEEH
jgi:hypothetical protein